MAMTGRERQQRYRARARERGEALEQLPPVPHSQRDAVAGTISMAITRARQIRDRGDRQRVIDFWRQLARSQGLVLERDRLGAVLERRAQMVEGAGEAA